jgi:hypothetical protein
MVVRLALLSLLAVFKDLLPGYRIRGLTEEEAQVNLYYTSFARYCSRHTGSGSCALLLAATNRLCTIFAHNSGLLQIPVHTLVASTVSIQADS